MIVSSVMQALDDNERAFVVKHIPAAEIRSYFVKNPHSYQSIVKGFQAKTLSDDMARKIVLTNFNKPFIQTFVEPYLQKWLKQIEDNYARFVVSSDEFTARILSVSSSVFADNTDLYFKVQNDDTSMDDIKRFKEEMDKHKEKERVDAFETEKKKLQQQIDESAGTILSLTQDIQKLQSELSAEKQQHQQTKHELETAIEDCNTLNNELAEAKNHMVSSATQASQMQDELARLRQLAKYADTESSNGYNDSYQYTSICSVWHNDNGQTCLTRIADIKNGIIYRFYQDNTQPRRFENRDRLFCKDGPFEDGTIGVWNWNAIPKAIDPSSDIIVTSYNQYAGLIEVIEFPVYSSFDEIAQYLTSGTIAAFSGRRILFAIPADKGTLNGLLCSENDFDMQNGKANLKSSVYMIPQYFISTSDLIDISGKRFFNRVTLGVPKNLYQIRKPLEVVKEILLKRARSAVFRQRGLSQKETQHCKDFLNDICTDTLYSEIADVYACTEEEASEYVSEFISLANTNLSDGDLDLTLLSEAINNNAALLNKCKDSIKTKWESENIETIKAAQSQLEKVKRSVDELEERYKNYQTELINIETQISSKKGLAAEVEHKIAEKIADAKQNAADFIAEMAFALPSNASQMPDIIVTKRKIQYSARDEIISDIDTFEDCLEENLIKAGYKKTSALNMSQTISFCIFNNMPIVVNENADRIADCISAMFGGIGVNSISLPIAEINCTQLVQCITERTKAKKAVFLIDGLFDGFCLNKFNEMMQHSFELRNSILVLALNGVSGDMLPVSVWNRAIYLDGDIGINDVYHESLNSCSSENITSEDIDEELIKKNCKTLKPFSAIIGNTAVINLARYMATSGGNISDNITVQIMLALSAKASGKTEKFDELLARTGITLDDEIKEKYL